VFFIVNKTKQTIIMGDIGVKLGPRQAIDLDKVIDRDKADSSKYLQMLVHKGDVEIKRKDDKTFKKKPVDETKKLNQIKSEILDEMKNMLKSHFKQESSQSISIEDIAKLIQPGASIEDIKKIVNEAINNANIDKEISKDEDVQVDNKILTAIHAKTVNKKIKNITNSSVNYQKEEIDNAIANNVSELDSLLGG